MVAQHRFALKRSDYLLICVSLLALFPCLYYPYLSEVPQLGFTLNARTWQVRALDPCPPGEQCLELGDRVLAIGHVRFEDFARDRTLNILEAFGPDRRAPVRLLRDGRLLTLDLRVPGGEKLRVQTVLLMLFPLVFWLMGTVAIIFLRPRDERWLVLVLFSYVNAIWLSAGLASGRQAGGSAVVLHGVIWLFLPLAVHLHTVLPDALPARGRRALLLPLYALSLALAALDSWQLLGDLEPFYTWSFLAGVALSLGLLLVRLFLPLDPAVKLANRIMLYGVLLGFGPIILFFLVVPTLFSRFETPTTNPLQLYPWALGLSLVSVPILPLSYIYAIYKHYLGALEFRANRLLGVYSFSSLYITMYAVVLFLVSSRWAPMNERTFAATLTISLLFVGGAPFLRNRFQALVDRHVFGIRHSPEEVIEIVSERIPLAFDRTVLGQVIVEEILPTLLIRQSALYLFEGAEKETIYEQALPEGPRSPGVAELRALLHESGRYLPPPPPGQEGRRSWVRLVVPLAVKAETIGIWLIGRRDPDDFYPSSDVHLLSTVANQIAPMLENIRLYERAQREIAQRKSAEQEIRRSEERFRNLFEATLEGIALVRNGVILEVNQALLAIFGYEAGAPIGRRLSDLVSAGEAALYGVPREGTGFKRDGSRIDIEVAGKKYVFQGEDVTVVAIRDITRRKQDEAENRMLQRQLIHSQKMEAIGRLSAGVAHDFNNCLLAIFGYSDMLLAAYHDDEPLCRNLTGIKEAGQKAAALTKQLLAFTRQQPMEARVLALNEVVSGLEKMLHRLIGEDVELATELHPGLSRVKIDPAQIEQVLMNLAVNSRHAMPRGGRLTIRTAPIAVAPGACAPHADVPPGSYVLLSVADTGEGMDAETQSRVFEPFFTTKKLGEGTGLGLSTAYGIIKQSGGHIFVDSAPGKGAAFTIYLPAAGGGEEVAKAAAGGTADLGSETILLAEDEEKVRALLHQILSGKGYRVLLAASGGQALALAGSHDGPIHLLLTDVIMPQMKGPELAARLRAARPGVRVIYMSGYNEEPLQGEEAAAAVCLQKPFSAQALARTVRTVLDAAGSTKAA